jgi:iron complex outermembrane receptor protein
LKIKPILLGCISTAMVILNSLQVQAQCDYIVSGIVRDADTGEPLPYSSIAVKGKSGGTITGFDGSFRLEGLCLGELRLMVSHLACEKTDLILMVSRDTSIVVELPHKHNELNEVLIVKSKMDDMPLLKSDEISGDQLALNSGKSLAEGLTSVTGVTMLRTGSTVSKPVVHGLSGNRVLILNNGIRLEGQQWGSEHAPEIDPFIAKRLTVIKGSGTVRFGPDAIGGVILVEPATLPQGSGWGAETNLVGVSSNREGAISSMIQFSPEKLPALAFRLQGTLKQGGDVRTPEYYLKNTGFREQNFSWSAGWNKQDYGFSAFYSQFNSEVGIFTGSHIGNLTDLELAFELEEPLEQRPFSYEIGRPFQKISHELFKASAWSSVGTSGKFTLNLARQYNLREEYDKDFNVSANNGDSSPELNYEITSKSAELLWDHNMNSKISGLIGLSFMHQANTFEGRMFIPNYESLNTGFFITEKWLAGDFSIESGIRVDFRNLDVFMRRNAEVVKDPYDYRALSGMLSGKWEPTDSTSVLLSISTGWRPPGVNELYSNGLHHGSASVEIGNKDLNEERSLGANFSITHYLFNQIEMELDAYYTDFNGFVYLQPIKPATLTVRGAFPTFRYMQADADLYGADLQLSRHLTSSIELIGGASFIRAYNKDREAWISQMPSDKWQLGLNWERHTADEMTKWGIGCSVDHVLEQTRGVSDDYVNAPASYTITNIEVFMKRILKAHPIHVSLSIENLFDVSYRDYMNRYRYFADEEGVSFSVRLKKTFGSVDRQN